MPKPSVITISMERYTELMMAEREVEELKVSEMTKDEFFSVAKKLKPGITREEYDAMWASFMKHKKMKEAN